MAAEHAGIPYDELIEQIVEMAWRRRRDRREGVMQASAMAGSHRREERAEARAEKAATEKAATDKAEEKPLPTPVVDRQSTPPRPAEEPPAPKG